MELFIRVDENKTGKHFWLYHDEYKSYLSEEFWTADNEPWLPPIKSVKEARRLMKLAKQLIMWDGASGKFKASYWRVLNGKLIEVKFAKDNKIKC